MKLTKETLKQLIQEELSDVIGEGMMSLPQLLKLKANIEKGLDAMQEQDPEYFPTMQQLKQTEAQLEAHPDYAEYIKEPNPMVAGGAFDQQMGVDRYRE